MDADPSEYLRMTLSRWGNRYELLLGFFNCSI